MTAVYRCRLASRTDGMITHNMVHIQQYIYCLKAALSNFEQSEPPWCWDAQLPRTSSNTECPTMTLVVHVVVQPPSLLPVVLISSIALSCSPPIFVTSSLFSVTYQSSRQLRTHYPPHQQHVRSTRLKIEYRLDNFYLHVVVLVVLPANGMKIYL